LTFEGYSIDSMTRVSVILDELLVNIGTFDWAFYNAFKSIEVKLPLKGTT
jgi:hypothetical protein